MDFTKISGRLAVSFLLLLSPVRGLAEPTPVELKSLEFWAFRPDMSFPPVRNQVDVPDSKHQFGTLYVDVNKVSASVSLDGLRFQDGAFEIDTLSARMRAGRIYARGYTTVRYPTISRSGVGLKKKTYVVPVVTLNDTAVVLSSKQKLRVTLPEKIELKMTPQGRIELANRAGLIAYLQDELDRFTAYERFDESFSHWFVNVPAAMVGEYAVEKLFEYEKREILSMVRQTLREKLSSPDYLDPLVQALNEALPITVAKDFRGVNFTLEKWSLYAGAQKQRVTAWRLLPADQKFAFSDVVVQQIPPADVVDSPNYFSVAIHTKTLDRMFRDYLRGLRKEPDGLFLLSMAFGTNADLPVLFYSAKKSEMPGLVHFLRGFEPNLGTLSSRIGIYVDGENAPQIRPWYEPNGKQFIDVAITFALREKEARESLRPLKLVLTFSANSGQIFNLDSVRGPKESVAPDTRMGTAAAAVFDAALGTRVKYLLAQTLASQKLELSSEGKRADGGSKITIDGVRMLGDLSTSGLLRSPTARFAEALVIDMKLQAESEFGDEEE